MKSYPSLLLFLIWIFMIINTIEMQAFPDDIETCLGENERTPLKKTDKRNLYKGQVEFSISLLKAINKMKPNENIFLSPYSTYHALLLAYFGSVDKTEKELQNGLYLNWAESKENVYNAYKLEKRIRSFKDNNIEFGSVDKIYVGLDTPLRNCIRQLFAEEIENLDFQGKPEQTRLNINDWVSNVTRNEITEFLKQGDVNSETKMILANAAYFKGQWETKFNITNTKEEIFYSGKGKTAPVSMMNHRGNFHYTISEELNCHILELPYKGEKFSDVSMIIFLPPYTNDENGLQKILNNLTPDNLNNAMNDLELRDVKLSLPRYSLEERLELTPFLNMIGINELFTRRANLQGFSNEYGLLLNDALHFAKIKVDEEGSIASAATGLFGFRKERPMGIVEFTCNHPFLFMIYDHKSKAILFFGLYQGPN
ncbi:serine protease inhibitor 88Ea-like [Condylostylus longicornis]|uniref:serine protease inhibitor 88Ea-like n=1 Tax=Condylostylus longicornis TaxID=2530218 RepID=UPI00244E2C89|nr:serine protease inhibitor 88Ea-like [Condylostylus longicornis]